MVVACWSAKGGSGTTVVALALAVLAARSSPSGALLVDIGGDVPRALGMSSPPGPGVLDWLAAPPEVGGEALDRLGLTVDGGLRVIARGAGSGPGDRLTAVLAERSPVVVDCGEPSDVVGAWVAATLPVSLVVVRPCSLALQRLREASTRPTGVIVVDEPGHRIDARDIGEAAGAPVVARVPWDPAVARSVDSGSLGTRLPRSLARSLRGVL